MKQLKELITNIYPGKETFFNLAESHSLVPVVAELPLDETRSTTGIYKDIYYQYKYSFLLDSGKGEEKNSRYSFLGGNPFLRFEYQNQAITVWEEGKILQKKRENPMESLAGLLEKYKTTYFSYVPHFFGGGIGYFSYELAHKLEPFSGAKKNDLLDLPDIHFIFINDLIVIDHFEKKIKFITLVRTDEDRIEKVYYNAVFKLTERINRYQHASCKEENLNFKKNAVPDQSFRSSVTKKQFIEMVEKAKDYIKDGEIYQANLSRRFDTVFDEEPLTLYRFLQIINPSPFSAFLKFDDFFIVSSSPERLVKVYKNEIETRPIAGTRPRGHTASQDKILSKELLLSEKEKAEHLMLLDLERNDLGRLCKYGSIKVDEFMGLEKYSHVWHIVSNIKGELRKGVALNEILKACFPGGTITGCPKIRSMEIIDEIEKINRGPYTGSLGYIGFSGEMDLNIIIRTILLKDSKACFHVGAGIVADSDPEKEYYETFNKAEAMLSAFSCKKNCINIG